MKAMMVHPQVYVLLLEDNCMYVGNSLSLSNRLSQHWQGLGARWTKLHKPVSVLEVHMVADGEDANDLENKRTLELMQEHGADKVRGGRYCAI